MKKIILGFLSFMLIAGSVTAQDGKKDLKKGIKQLGKYVSSPDNQEALTEGFALLESAFSDSEISGDSESYIKMGDIYNKISLSEIKQKLINPAYVLQNQDISLKAFEAYNKVLAMSQEKGDVKDALSGIKESENNLYNTGIILFEDQNYGEAFDFYKASIDAHDILSANSKPSRLDDAEAKTEHLFITAASGYYGEKQEASKPYFVKLYEQDYGKALVYEALYNLASADNDAKAIDYLNKGRELFPDDTGLLFAEINFYLKEGRLEELIQKLESARVKEPENVSIVVTLGNVYDQLSQKATADGNTEKATEYFDKAFKYYGEGLTMDPTNFDAAYSQGALYYNKAAGMTDEINALGEDYSTAGIAKYDALKATMTGYFDKALPYFENAESINPTDLNVLIALKEIYARKNMLEKASAYKAKIEAVK